MNINQVSLRAKRRSSCRTLPAGRNLLCMLIFLFLCGSVHAEESGVTQQLEGFNLNGYSNDGKKSWEVNGAKADIGSDEIKITDVDANFYGKENANLKSDKGVLNKTNGDVKLQDNVVITADRGTQMKTDSLNWNRNKDLMTTEDKVRIDDEQGTITGKGLKAQPNLKKAQLNENVKAVINTAKPGSGKNGQTVTITSDGPMQMDQMKMYAVFNENVVATEAATGRELRADKMQVWFDEKNKKIRKAICSGNVVVIQGGNASYADEMVYNGIEGTLTMTGRPKLVFDTGETKGSGMFQPTGN
jgi:LPS export ABC transporter protein LptC/lipopolysaccharide transport protein LptA